MANAILEWIDEPGQTPLSLFPIAEEVELDDWSIRVSFPEVQPGLYRATVNDSISTAWAIFAGNTQPTSYAQALDLLSVEKNYTPVVQLVPGISSQEEVPPWNMIHLYLGGNNLINHSLFASDGTTPLDFTGQQLVMCIANHLGATIAEIEGEALAVDGNNLQWIAPSVVIQREDVYSWALRDRAASKALRAHGDLAVKYAARTIT